MKEFKKLAEIIKTLRGPNGCQWDKEQTFDTMRVYLLEETYEVIESIMSNNFVELKEELGDLLCQVVFLAQLADDDHHFTIEEVVQGISDKLINRHPHVFGDIKTNDTQVILKNWEKIKKEEKKHRNSILDGIPKTLPSLAKAYKAQEKASRVGFDWDTLSGPIAKLEEELREFKEALLEREEKQTSNKDIENELGDLLFSIVNVSRFLSIDSEFALQKSVDKFISRFHHIEKYMKNNNLLFEQMNLEMMNKLWDEAKTLE